MKKQSYYEVLGVSKDASDTDIRKAYRAKVRSNHPDTVQDEEEKKILGERLKAISGAFDVLSDEESRAHYDKHGVAPDEEKPVSIHDEMLDYITTIFQMLVDDAINKNKKLTSLNFVELIKVQASRQTKDMVKAKLLFIEQREALASLLDRFIRKINSGGADDKNVFRENIENRLAIVTEKVDEITLGIKMIKRAREELDLYDNIVDIVAMQVNTFGANASVSMFTKSRMFYHFHSTSDGE